MTYLYFRSPQTNLWQVTYVSPDGGQKVVESHASARVARQRAIALRSSIVEGSHTQAQGQTQPAHPLLA